MAKRIIFMSNLPISRDTLIPWLWEDPGTWRIEKSASVITGQVHRAGEGSHFLNSCR